MCDVNNVYVYVIEEKRKQWVLAGCGNRSRVRKKGPRTKVEVNDRLKDKYQYFISILIMHVIYEFDL